MTEPKASAWQPIETAPKDGTEVLLSYPNGAVALGRWRDRQTIDNGKVVYHYQGWSCDGMVWPFCLGPEPQPKYWIPLPPAPKNDEQAAA